MTFQRWWYDGSKRSINYSWKTYSNSHKTKYASRNKLWLVVPLLVVLSIAAVYNSGLHSSSSLAQVISRASDGGSALAPSSPTATVTVSPSSVVGLTPGSTFSVQVQVINMPQFSGWDIQLKTFPAVINATSLSITGNDFAVNASGALSLEFIHCVNGVGSGCTSSDGPGIVHSSLESQGIVSGNGLLFTVTYKVTTAYPYCPIAIQNDLISDPLSGSNVPHSVSNGVYGVLPTVVGLGAGGFPARQE